jgi:hypothetical protein
MMEEAGYSKTALVSALRKIDPGLVMALGSTTGGNT